MLPLWSSSVVVSIAQNSASIGLDMRTTELLSDIAHPNNTETLIAAFANYRSRLDQRRIRFVISNHFMRYLVLPWAPGVTARQDWLALAEQAMRKQYGAIAADWVLKVNLAKHGAPVIAAAMDNKLYHAINEMANAFNCKISAIEPLLMTISRKHQSQNSFLISEPGRLLFCEVEQGQIKQFVAVSPPDMQTLDHAKQMIERHFLLKNQYKVPVLNYVSSALTRQSNNMLLKDSDLEQPILLNKRAVSHSCWLAGL